jgi:hypothetical protein
LIETPGLDNVTLAGVTAAVPEPSTLAMMTIAVVAVGAVVMFLNRQRRARPARHDLLAALSATL